MVRCDSETVEIKKQHSKDVAISRNNSSTSIKDSGLPNIEAIFGSQNISKGEKNTDKNSVPPPPASLINDKKIENGKGAEGAKSDKLEAQNSSSKSYQNIPRVKTPTARGENDTKYTECPFVDFGCTMTGEAIQVRRHIRDENSLHLSQMCAAVTEMSEASKNALQEITEMNNESESIVSRVMQVTNLYSHCYSSQFIWHITNYSESYARARRGEPPVIYSPPFSSHRQGYKLAAAIGLYGDGDAIGEYNSVFITLLRGEYDPILQWPFKCPIKFTLINLKGGKNVEATITPRTTENNLPFLGKPTSDRNPAFGLKNFADLRLMTESNGFIANNSCFLKIDIDLDPIYNHAQ
uniref:MATH domain-containing protein n=1 Tax=Syphacia muris TaxID=451379 RepID=A0A0N5AUT9_9BILA